MRTKEEVKKCKKFFKMGAFGISALFTFLNILPSPLALADPPDPAANTSTTSPGIPAQQPAGQPGQGAAPGTAAAQPGGLPVSIGVTNPLTPATPPVPSSPRALAAARHDLIVRHAAGRDRLRQEQLNARNQLKRDQAAEGVDLMRNQDNARKYLNRRQQAVQLETVRRVPLNQRVQAIMALNRFQLDERNGLARVQQGERDETAARHREEREQLASNQANDRLALANSHTAERAPFARNQAPAIAAQPATASARPTTNFRSGQLGRT